MLYLVATPIGNPKDITLRALEYLREVDVIIGEERKVTSKFLKSIELTGKSFQLLNEHSTPDEVKELVDVCKNQNVALITDCGTPGFCDPGADLVKQCRRANIPMTALPGASSLMTLVSLSGISLKQFFFRGFLPGNKELRQQEWKKLKSTKVPIIIMDTPYRLEKTMAEVNQYLPKSQCLLGISLTQKEEGIYQGTAQEITKQLNVKKAEFILLIYP